MYKPFKDEPTAIPRVSNMWTPDLLSVFNVAPNAKRLDTLPRDKLSANGQLVINIASNYKETGFGYDGQDLQVCNNSILL